MEDNMAKYPDYGEGEFSLMVDPFTGRVGLICPAPIISFEDIGEFSEWVNGFLGCIPQLTLALNATQGKLPDLPITKDYATTVIEAWQTQIMESLNETQKKTGRKKSVKKQKSSMNEDPS